MLLFVQAIDKCFACGRVIKETLQVKFHLWMLLSLYIFHRLQGCLGSLLDMSCLKNEPESHHATLKS